MIVRNASLHEFLRTRIPNDQTCFTGVKRAEVISVLIDGATVIFSPVEEFWLDRKCYKRAIAILDPDRTAEKTVARYGQIQR